MKDETLSAEELLRKVLRLLAASCEENKKLYNVLLNYLMQLKKSGIDTNERVRRRTIRLRHLMSTILIKGIQNKEFKDLNVKDLNEILYGLLEAGMFRIAVLNQNNISEIDNAINTVVDSIKM